MKIYIKLSDYFSSNYEFYHFVAFYLIFEGLQLPTVKNIKRNIDVVNDSVEDPNKSEESDYKKRKFNGTDNENPRENSSNRQICLNFKAGDCKNGDKCLYLHVSGQQQSPYKQSPQKAQFHPQQHQSPEKQQRNQKNQQNHKKLDDCNKSIVDGEEDYNNYRIYNSTERYKIEPKSPYAEIMKTHNQKYIGGPSGSTSVLYITLFQLYRFPFTYKNKIMLLGLLIADYVPLWHTIPEILLMAYPEWKDNKIKPYTLDQDPVLYSIRLLKPFV